MWELAWRQAHPTGPFHTVHLNAHVSWAAHINQCGRPCMDGQCNISEYQASCLKQKVSLRYPRPTTGCCQMPHWHMRHSAAALHACSFVLKQPVQWHLSSSQLPGRLREPCLQLRSARAAKRLHLQPAPAVGDRAHSQASCRVAATSFIAAPDTRNPLLLQHS